MIRITTLLWIALLVVAGGTVMHVSYRVRHVEKHLSELSRETRQEQDAIRILTAEWDTLNDPERIDALSKRHLTLEATPIARVVALEAIPFKQSDDLRQPGIVPAASAKTSKGPVPTTKIAAAKPEVMTSAPLPPAAQDGVGLILARMEWHE